MLANFILFLTSYTDATKHNSLIEYHKIHMKAL